MARGPVYRQRRFPPLPWQLKVGLAALWLAYAAAVFSLVHSWGGRLGLVIIGLFALPLLVVVLRDPTRRQSR